MTVIDMDAGDVNSAWLENTLTEFLLRDDVIEPAFFPSILLVGPKEFEPKTFDTKWGMSTVRAMQRIPSSLDVTGPYIAHENAPWQVLRL